MISAALPPGFPFIENNFEKLYLKQKYVEYADEVYTSIVEYYLFDNTFVEITETAEGLFSTDSAQRIQEYDPELQTATWRLSEYLEVLFSNYELRIVGFQQVLARDCVVIELHDKKQNSLKIKYVVDLKTGISLNEYYYDEDGKLVESYEAVSVDYDPDVSHINLDNTSTNDTVVHFERISKTELLERLPWVDLDSLLSPEGFRAVDFFHAIYETEVLDFQDASSRSPQQTYQSTGFTIIISDGLETIDIVIMFDSLLESVAELLPEAIIAIVEKLSATTIAIVLNEGQDMAIAITSDVISHEERIEIIKALTNIELVLDLTRE